MPEFVTSEITRKAYLGKHAQDLVALSSEQVAVVYQQRGIIIPVEVSSTLSVIALGDSETVTGIAEVLGVAHQLAAKRLSRLVELGLVTKTPDPDDKRRTVISITETGQDQARRLEQCMAEMSEVYGQLYEEIECDLAAALQAAMDHLRAKPLVERFAERDQFQDAG
ncbi:MAG: MarR family transcriptional regulator [Pseudomonadota bacterium]